MSDYPSPNFPIYMSPDILHNVAGYWRLWLWINDECDQCVQRTKGQCAGAVSESRYCRSALIPLKLFCTNDFEFEGGHDFEIIVPAKNMNLIKAPKMYDVIHCPPPDPELCHNLSIESGTAAGSSQPCMLNGELTETQNLFQLPSSSALGHGTSRQSNIWEYFHINRGV